MKSPSLRILFILLGLSALGPMATAQTYPSSATYAFSGTNPNSGGGIVAAQVVFSVTANGSVTIDLSNTQSTYTPNNTDVLEGVLFDTTITTKVGSTAAGAWATVATGSNLLDASGGVVGAAGTDISSTGGNGAWAFKNLGVGTTSDGRVHNYGIGDSGAYGMSTGPGKGGLVASATFPGGPGHPKQGSANKPPWTDNAATFRLSGITGLTSANQITNVYFIYGTAGTASPQASLQGATPEPGSLALLGASLLSAAVWLRKRKRIRK